METSCGIDSVTHVAFINISTSNPCIVNLPTTGTAMTQTGCAGTIYDSGGPGANYGDNEDGTVTISPVGASSITLTFTQFSLENNYDYLYVYDGPTTASTLIGQYTGNALPNGGVINTNSGSVTIRMTSDVGVNQAGFTIGWQCTIPTLPPFVNFSVSPSTSCNGVISFDDNSSNGANAWTWNFGDGSTSNQQNPTHTYLNNGTYDVKLIACNNIGCDSLTQYAIVNIARPAAPATANASRCDSGVVTLSVLGTGNMYWYSDSTATNQVNVGSTYTTPGLNTTTTYYVQEHQSNPPLLCGPANHTFGTGGYYSNATDRYLIFSNTAPINLISVDVDAQAAGSRTIELRDAGNNVLQSLIVNLNAGWNTVTLNFALPVGTNLHLGFNGTANCYRNQSGAVFPYNATGNGPVSITGTNGNAGYYYFFYNWQLGSPDCISLISPVTAIIGSPSASTTPSGAISICNGQSLTITANNGNQYLWSTGDTTQSITVTTGGQYYVTVGDAFCSAVSDTVNLDILAAPVATVSPTGSVDACNGDTIQLQAFGGGTYTWSNGATDSIINVATTGNYSVIVSNGTCTDTSVGTQVNVVDVQAGFYTFFLNLGYTFVDTSSNATSWFWDLGDGTTSTSQNPAHMYTTTGAFTVTLIVSNGNCTDTATMLIDVIDGINSTSNTWTASLYPNPANNNFTLSLQGNSNSNIQFEVVNMLGQQIDLPFNEIAVGHLWNFNSESLSAGVYWVKVSVNNSSSYLKLVKE